MPEHRTIQHIPEENLSYAREDDPVLFRAAIQTIEAISGKSTLRRLYREALRLMEEGLPFWEAGLKVLNVQFEVGGAPWCDPDPGKPLVVIGNHPYGVVDGLYISKLVYSLRSDFRLLTNEVLCRHPAVQPYLLPIDFRGTREANRINVGSRKESLSKLLEGTPLVIFPGAGVATRNRPGGPLEELPWGNFTAKIIQQSEANILPVYFHGENSWVFHYASRFSETVRLALFLYETRKLIGKSIQVSIRPPIMFGELTSFRRREEMMEFLLERTLAGASQHS